MSDIKVVLTKDARQTTFVATHEDGATIKDVLAHTYQEFGLGELDIDAQGGIRNAQATVLAQGSSSPRVVERADEEVAPGSSVFVSEGRMSNG